MSFHRNHKGLKRHVKQAVKARAKLACGGERYSISPCDKGYYYKPTIQKTIKPACQAAKEIDAGTVWVNMTPSSQMSGPFGGNKNSGLGREYGLIGLHEYLKVKNNVWYMGDIPYKFY
ncbi:MAG: aldehyde dehydrogenase family protein [Clostridia bacterium]|nr:aldehyde dehydrogenase family protein [Clostridia bacterium]